MNLFEVNNLKISFDDVVVIKNFDATFNEGIHHIKGKNGSGKSSLLKTFCGVYPVQSGEVIVSGLNLVTKPVKAKMMLYYVPDKPEVYPFMTGRQFLRMLGQIKKSPLDESLNHWIRTINLEQHLETPFMDMSLGTQRKFLLCGILIASPEVIFLDEPFNGLDVETMDQVHRLLLELSKERCIIITSHLEIIKDNCCSTIINI